MAGQEGKKSYNLRRTQGNVLNRTTHQKKYFYIDGKLYKSLQQNRPANLLRAWCYTDRHVADFVWSDVKRNMQQAFDTHEVCTLLNRSRHNIFLHLRRGAINAPQRIGVKLDHDARLGSYNGYFKWSEDDVLALHEYYLTVGSGRPRKDGMITVAVRIPSRLELVAMMKQNKMFYVQDSDGNFVPIFDQPDWT